MRDNDNKKKRGFDTPEFDPISGAIGYLSTEGKTEGEAALLEELKKFQASGGKDLAAARSAIGLCAALITSDDGKDHDALFWLMIELMQKEALAHLKQDEEQRPEYLRLQ